MQISCFGPKLNIPLFSYRDSHLCASILNAGFLSIGDFILLPEETLSQFFDSHEKSKSRRSVLWELPLEVKKRTNRQRETAFEDSLILEKSHGLKSRSDSEGLAEGVWQDH